LRAKGGEFLVFPATSLWWLEHYRGFGKYLERTHRCISKDEHCMIYHLS
jgi:hypothetical protein